MKKLIFLLLVFAGFLACENESIQDLPEETSVTEGINARQGDKIDICHYDKDNNSWHVINVSVNSLSAHQGHGDAVDMDGDGYFDIENECSEGIDCDDMNPDQFPGAEEAQWWYFFGEDNDGDGWITFDEVFGDCRPSGYLNEEDAFAAWELLGFPGLGDCDDENPNVNPAAPEICDDVDDNCDGYLLDRSASVSFDGIDLVAGFARFGGSGTVSGEWVDTNGTGCDPIAEDLTGKIAIIDRGECNFTTKVINAQNKGAIGVIICNVNDDVIIMAGDDPGITIPSIFLGQSDCEFIKNSGIPAISFTVEDTCVESGDRMSNTVSKKIISGNTFDRATGKFITLDTTK